MFDSMARIRPLSRDYQMTARTVRAVWDRMVDAVRHFGDERRLQFRGRKLGNEAFINVAVWHFAELPIAEQERALRLYLPRIEAALGSEVEAAELHATALPAPAPRTKKGKVG